MGRPAKGTVDFNVAKKVWEVRVTLKDGTRTKPVAMPGLDPCTVCPDVPPKGCTCITCVMAEDAGQRVSERVREGRFVFGEQKIRKPILEGPFNLGGRKFWRGRIWLADGSKVRVDIPEHRRYSEESARQHLEYEQEREDAEQTIFNARKQPNGAGSVERRGEIWWVRISLPKEHEWEPLQRQRIPIPNSGQMSKEEAQQAGAELSRRVHAGEIVVARPPPLPPVKRPTGFDWSYLRYLEWRVRQFEESKAGVTEQDVLVALSLSKGTPLRMTALRRVIGERRTGTKTKATASSVRVHLDALVQKGLVVKCEVPRINGGEPEAWKLARLHQATP